jgi:hypothetical protein
VYSNSFSKGCIPELELELLDGFTVLDESLPLHRLELLEDFELLENFELPDKLTLLDAFIEENSVCSPKGIFKAHPVNATPLVAKHNVESKLISNFLAFINPSKTH